MATCLQVEARAAPLLFFQIFFFFSNKNNTWMFGRNVEAENISLMSRWNVPAERRCVEVKDNVGGF